MSFLNKIITKIFCCNKKYCIFETTNKNIEFMKKYKVEVWFRYISNGEQEKDFDIHEVVANNFEMAAEKALSYYDEISNKIPFATKNVTP